MAARVEQREKQEVAEEGLQAVEEARLALQIATLYRKVIEESPEGKVFGPYAYSNVPGGIKELEEEGTSWDVLLKGFAVKACHTISTSIAGPNKGERNEHRSIEVHKEEKTPWAYMRVLIADFSHEKGRWVVNFGKLPQQLIDIKLKQSATS